MNQQTKKKWVAALRSGEYKQGDGALRAEKDCDDDSPNATEERFCCLGVLCDIVEPKQWCESNGEWLNGADSNDGAMPREALLKKTGLNKMVNRSGNTNDTIAQKLASMNDNGKTFNEIADWIESRKF